MVRIKAGSALFRVNSRLIACTSSSRATAAAGNGFLAPDATPPDAGVEAGSSQYPGLEY
jgi:hypothetical protein